MLNQVSKHRQSPYKPLTKFRAQSGKEEGQSFIADTFQSVGRELKQFGMGALPVLGIIPNLENSQNAGDGNGKWLVAGAANLIGTGITIGGVMATGPVAIGLGLLGLATSGVMNAMDRK